MRNLNKIIGAVWTLVREILPRKWRRIIKIMRLRYLREQWIRQGAPLPPPPSVKHLALLETQARFSLMLLIETGTFRGDTSLAMQPFFSRITTIELSEELHQKAVKRLAPYNNIRLIHGDSGTRLRECVFEAQEPAIFWLDGHFSGGETAKSDINTPIRAEIQTIFSSDLPHVILIDDARCFNGEDDYPTVEELKNDVQSSSCHSYSMEIRDDIIRLTPGPTPVDRKQDGREPSTTSETHRIPSP